MAKKIGELNPNVTKPEIDAVVARLQGDNTAVRAFSESLQVGQIIGGDLLVVLGAVQGLLKGSGLTMRALCVLIQDAGGKGPGGRPRYSIEEVEHFLGVLASLDQFLVNPTPKGRVLIP